MSTNAGGVDTVDFLSYASGVPVAVGQTIAVGATEYIVTGSGGRGSDGALLLNVRAITTLAAASTITVQGVTILNDAATINAI